MSRFLMIFAALMLTATLSFAQVPGSVVITEVMYDDTASTDAEWVEIHNTTATAIDISGWILQDDSVYPPDGGEGAIEVPANTTLPANGYLVLCRVDLPEISDEVLCSQIIGSWTLGNSGDNLALYTASAGGILIDGSLTAQYPDLAGTNLGNSIEKCDPNAGWTSDPAAWHESTHEFATSGRYRHCTPGFANSACADSEAPTIVSCLALSETEVDVLFSENVEQTSAETVDNYTITPGLFTPTAAVQDGGNLSLVHLTFAPLANNTYTLSVNDVLDMFGNPAVDATCEFTVNISINPCDVVITEIMYDDTASTDAEWVEIHNTTNAPIDISGWILTDDSVYPPDGGEGAIEVPANTVLAAGGYAILCRVDLDFLVGEIVCATVSGSWTLGNSGDNLALFTSFSGGQLVDGSLTDNYPDLASSNAGNSIEKCDYTSCWTSDASAWTETVVHYASEGQYRHCTPFDQGFCCPDPADGLIELIVAGPPTWAYRLVHSSGCIDRVVFTNFCDGTTGSVDGDALAAGWTVMTGGDGNDGDSVIFLAATPLNAGSLDGLQLNHPTCADFVSWEVGLSNGSVEGPLPVELNSFSAAAGNGFVVLNWSTASETELDKYELRRDGEVISNVSAQNSETGATYSYTDRNVANDVTYGYELSVISLNGERDVLATASATPRSENTVVTEFALYQNYPNPFNPETSIRFDLAEASDVTLMIFNIAGQEVATLVNGTHSAGAHTVNFDGAALTSGVYLYRLTAGEFVSTMKMVLMK